MTDTEREQKRLERESTKFIKENEVKKTKQSKAKKHKRYGKSTSRFVKFWLPLKKAVWIFRSLIETGKLDNSQTEYLKKELEKELKNNYEGVKNENKV